MNPTTPSHDHKNLTFAVLLCAVLIVAWQFFIEMPKREKLAQWNRAQELKKHELALKAPITPAASVNDVPMAPMEALAKAPRVKIATPLLDGSISLKGLRFDDLKLVKYKETLESDSPEVTLLSPSGVAFPYFMQVGWSALDKGVKIPDNNSQWKASATSLTPETPVIFSWDNGQGITFKVSVSVDKDYMFTLHQQVENRTSHAVNITPYALLNRAYEDPKTHVAILHEGPLGVEAKSLKEIQYSELKEKGSHAMPQASGWLGFTDKYWLAALVPSESEFKANFSHFSVQNKDRYQADYQGTAMDVPAGGNASADMRFFAGAKEIEVLDNYTNGINGSVPIPLFDRAVDFGMLYFLTKPIFLTINAFYHMLGNFGLAILLFTVLIKLLMYPLASKAFKSSAQLRELQPEMVRLREQCGDDKLKLQQEMMALYKRQKVNPAAGCLPILIQIPVFFALYKVLFVTIEMRHAPFYGWIKDLSAMDHSNLFTLFGLVPWNHPSWLHLGLLPILMCATMVIQMRQQPAPPDPAQAKMMKLMPYFFLFFFYSTPSGLLIYWIWSNTISIIQQKIIQTRFHASVVAKQQAKV